MESRTTISVSAERREQLREISAAFGGMNATSTLGEMARYLARMGVITVNVRGIEVNRLSDGLVVIVDGGKPLALSFEEADELANTIMEFVESNDPASALLDLDVNYAIERRGPSLALRLPATAPARVLSYDVAEDLAHVLRREVAAGTEAAA